MTHTTRLLHVICVARATLGASWRLGPVDLGSSPFARVPILEGAGTSPAMKVGVARVHG